MKKHLEMNLNDLYAIIADYSHCDKDCISITIKDNDILIIVDMEANLWKNKND